MRGFEYLFTFYGLLLGLAVANVATGFAGMWRSRVVTKAGWATPLLGLFILLAAAQQWVSFWGGRDSIGMGPWELLVSLAVAFPYIFVSQAMFPKDHDRWPSLEDHYLAHNRVLLAVLLVPPLASQAYNIGRYGNWPQGEFLVYLGARVGIPLILILVQRLWVHRVGLALLSAAILGAIFYFFY
jgi:hypothetical protein